MSGALDPVRWSRVEAVFQEAVELPDPERSLCLDRACGSDAELRAEVESLLAHAGGDLSEPIAGLSRLAKELLDGDPRSLGIGSLVGPYRLERILGRGGAGLVYLGERRLGTPQRVAIKVMPRALFSIDAMRHFRTERHILGELDHPNIAKLLDAGTTSEGIPYVITEFVDGLPLNHYCDERTLPLEARIRLFLSVCAAVRYAHEQHVVHRDLKPANILVTADGVIKLLDFGIAKLLTPGEPPQGPTLNRFMTPRFASPEQLRGDPLDSRSDVYSLGLILYLLVTGMTPRYTADPDRSDVPARPRAPRPPSAVCSDRGLKGDVDAIVVRALLVDRAERYQSVGSLVDDLDRYLTDRPVTARPHTWSYRAGKFARRLKRFISEAQSRSRLPPEDSARAGGSFR